MTNYNDIDKIHTLNQLCSSLGFAYRRSENHGWIEGNLDLMPREELVIYNTDMAMFVGSVEDLVQFLRGWEKAHQYLNMLGATSAKIIERKKLDYRNKVLVRTIKDSGKNDKAR